MDFQGGKSGERQVHTMTQYKKENILFAQKKKRIMAGTRVATVGRWACFQQKGENY